VSRKWRNWYQNEVDKEIKGVGSRDKLKHNERSDHIFRQDDVNGRTASDFMYSSSKLLTPAHNTQYYSCTIHCESICEHQSIHHCQYIDILIPYLHGMSLSQRP